MTFYKIRYKTKCRTMCRIVKAGELGVWLDRCHKMQYEIINIEFV